MKYTENLDHHSDNYNPQNYNGIDFNDMQIEMSLSAMERQQCAFNMYCPKL